MEGLSYEEIARVLDTWTTVVRGQLHRAQATLTVTKSSNVHVNNSNDIPPTLHKPMNASTYIRWKSRNLGSTPHIRAGTSSIARWKLHHSAPYAVGSDAPSGYPHLAEPIPCSAKKPHAICESMEWASRPSAAGWRAPDRMPGSGSGVVRVRGHVRAARRVWDLTIALSQNG